MKRTALYAEHKKLGGKMVDFAGWELPVMYSSIMNEHIATRTGAGIFDVSHMGEIIVKGESAPALLRRLIPTRLDRLVPGKSMYSCLCNDAGGVIDDLFIFMIAEQEYYIVVNAATTEKDLAWMRAHQPAGAEITDVSSQTAKIDVQGPKAKEILTQVVSDPGLERLERFYFMSAAFRDKKVLVSRTGYTGESGYEIYLDNAAAPDLWNALLTAGKDFGIQPVGLGARNTLRLDACYSLYGHEINDAVTPVEAGLKWLVNSTDDFIGREVLEKQKADGAPTRLVCFEMTGRGVPRDEYRLEKDGEDIGCVTSGTFSPTFKKGIGMARVAPGAVRTGDTVDVVIRNTRSPARVVKRPFYQYNG